MKIPVLPVAFVVMAMEHAGNEVVVGPEYLLESGRKAGSWAVDLSISANGEVPREPVTSAPRFCPRRSGQSGRKRHRRIHASRNAFQPGQRRRDNDR